MPYTIETLKSEVAVTFASLTQDDWLELISALTLDYKYDAVLEDLSDKFLNKINRFDIWALPVSYKEDGETDAEWSARILSETSVLVNRNVNKLGRIKKKFAAMVMEQYLREENIVVRIPHDTTYYMDFNGGWDLTLDYTFTNASATVNVTGDPGATDGVEVNDYIRPGASAGGEQWYKVTAVDDVGDTLTISPAFQQATQTTVTARLSDVSNNDSSGNYGTSTSNPCVHLNWYTTDTVRTAGDILKVRANQVHVYSGLTIEFDEDGDEDDWLTIKGCNSTDDPFSDSSDVESVIDLNDNSSSYLNISADNHWLIDGLDFIKCDTGNGCIYITYSLYVTIQNCNFYDLYDDGSSVGIRCIYGGNVVFDNCTFYDCDGSSLQLENGFYIVKNCTFNGGSEGTNRGILARGSTVYVEDSSFGQSTAHTTDDIAASYGSTLYTRNIYYQKAKPTADKSCVVFSEDFDQTFESNNSYNNLGDITRNTSVVRSGGSDSSALMVGWANYCGPNSPLKLSRGKLDGAFQVWCQAGVEVTISVWMRAYDAWATYPTASELYIQASYLSNAGTCARSLSTKSTQVLSDASTWVEFTTTFTPLRTGWAYVDVVLTNPGLPVDGVYVDLAIEAN